MRTKSGITLFIFFFIAINFTAQTGSFNIKISVQEVTVKHLTWKQFKKQLTDVMRLKEEQ